MQMTPPPSPVPLQPAIIVPTPGKKMLTMRIMSERSWGVCRHVSMLFGMGGSGMTKDCASNENRVTYARDSVRIGHVSGRG